MQTRRDFIKTAAGTSALAAFGGMVPGFLQRAAHAAEGLGTKGRVLVVIQLSGGNDGLNTVVPYEDDAYHRARPTLRLKKEQVLKLEANFGLHPELTAFQRLYEQGLFTIVQGVGYPDSDRDHDAAKRDWHSARPHEVTAQTGWLGRAIDFAADPNRAEVPGVFVGNIQLPFGLHAAQTVVPCIRSLDEWLLPGPAKRSFNPSLVSLVPRMWEARDSARGTPGKTLLKFLETETHEAISASKRLGAVLHARSAAESKYPHFPLAQTLRDIGNLIRADLGIRIYWAEQGGGDIGGFDTHAGQALNHGALLRELSESMAAFVDDLRADRLLDQVLIMTISEFGRTLGENGRRGTDHGAAAPVFFAGGNLKARLVGDHPNLTDLDKDAPKFHTDFRRLYATALQSWLKLDAIKILGAGFDPLEGLLTLA